MTTDAATPMTPRTPAAPRTRSPLRILAVAAAAGVALCALAGLAAAFWLAPMFNRMSDVPAGLDYSATRLSDAGLYRVTYIAEGGTVPVNQLHTWTLRVETADGQAVTDAEIVVDGDMPQHGHGMPTRPQVTQNLGNGEYLVEGMKFQMGGWWVMDFDITVGGQTDRVSFNMMLGR